MSILALDAGTTGVTALLVSTDLRVIARGYREFPQHFPAEGLVEHDPGEIWAATLAATRDLLATPQAAAAKETTRCMPRLWLPPSRCCAACAWPQRPLPAGRCGRRCRLACRPP